MADIDIAAEIANAMKNDERVNAALTEWLDERYPIGISEGVSTAGLKDAIRLVLEEARERAGAQDRRQDRVDELIAHVIKRQDEADARFNAFMGEMVEMRADNNALFASIEENLKDIRAQQAEHSDSLARIDRNVQRMGARISNMRGAEIERRLRRDMQTILINRFGCRRGEIVWIGSASVFASRDAALGGFRAKIEAAVDEGRISSDEFIGLEAADLIAKGALKSDGSEMWFIGEASGAISEDDVDRANDRAVALANLEGVRARAFVYGEYIDEAVADYASAGDVAVIVASNR